MVRLSKRVPANALLRWCPGSGHLLSRGPEALADFYAGLLASEGRHFRAYLKLAEARSPEPIDVRLNELKVVENELITAPDELFRFHSGPLFKQSASAAAELVL